MKVILFGATGMVGSGVLLECLDDAAVASVLVVARNPTGRIHPKLREIAHRDFFAYESLEGEFADAHACFFCLGVSSLGLAEPAYTRLTYDLTVAAASAMVAVNPGMTFCYVSGAGTDSSEHGKVMWAKVKGRTENRLLSLGFRAAFMFRPGYIQPVKGAKSKTPWINALYFVLSPVVGLAIRLTGQQVVTTAAIGQAMIHAARNGYPRPVLEKSDILAAAV